MNHFGRPHAPSRLCSQREESLTETDPEAGCTLLQCPAMNLQKVREGSLSTKVQFLGLGDRWADLGILFWMSHRSIATADRQPPIAAHLEMASGAPPATRYFLPPGKAVRKVPFDGNRRRF